MVIPARVDNELGDDDNVIRILRYVHADSPLVSGCVPYRVRSVYNIIYFLTITIIQQRFRILLINADCRHTHE